MHYRDGSIYLGTWKKDDRHGEGTMFFEDGSVYSGEWKRDARCGQGELMTSLIFVSLYKTL